MQFIAIADESEFNNDKNNFASKNNTDEFEGVCVQSVQPSYDQPRKVERVSTNLGRAADSMKRDLKIIIITELKN